VCGILAGIPALGSYFVSKKVGEILDSSESKDAEYEYVPLE
jgi:hypothetical protein